MKTKPFQSLPALSRLAALLWLAPLAMQAEDYTYITNSGTITITGYTGTNTAVDIPGTINGLRVTTIGDDAFFGQTLASVTLPDSVTSIGYSAFLECTNLANVMFGIGITAIGPSAFAWCAGLVDVTLPDSVTTVGEAAFELCTGLASITMPGVTNIADATFNACGNLTEVTLGNRVTRIGLGAFWGCALRSFRIPDSVTELGGGVFEWCVVLTNVTIPNGIRRILDGLFHGCVSLADVTIPESVTTIGGGMFAECESLTGVYFKGNAPATDFGLFSPGTSAIIYCLPGTLGWEPTFSGRPTALWHLPNPVILSFGPSFGVRTNCFGFIISWATNAAVVVEASASLASSSWVGLGTNTLSSSVGWAYFGDPDWTNHPARFYRVRSP